MSLDHEDIAGHGKIIERGHTSPEDIHHHSALIVPAESTARDTCGNGSYLFKYLDPRIRWASSSFPVPVYIDNTNGEVSASQFAMVAGDALKEWELFFGGNQFFKLVNDPSLAKMTLGWQHLDGSSNSVAVCEYSWNSSNDFRRADISLDTSENWVVMDHQVCGSTGSAFDIQNVLTHEIGHGVGFAHNTDNLSCMYASTRFGETLRRTLSNGDQKGFQELYQVTTPTPPPPPTPISSPLAKIISQSGINWVDTFYENINSEILPIAKIPLDQSQYAKIVTISGKSYVYTYFYRTYNAFATLGRIPISG